MGDAVSNAALQSEKPRDLDPNVLQRRASDPQASVWVNASAGTGKTKVLTDRVLRLLLPQDNGAPGCLPHKILCLTFTKAAASEMALRISKVLSRWAIMDDDDLQDALRKLLGREVGARECASARKLFAQVVDVPGGLKIMTIHSFCQSILGRFPLEAGVNPNFSVMEESDAAKMLLSAQQIILQQGSEVDHDSYDLLAAISNVLQIVNEDQFLSLLRAVASERHQFTDLLQRYFGVEGLYGAICNAVDVPAGLSVDDYLARVSGDVDEASLRDIARLMGEIGTKSDQTAAGLIVDWLMLDEAGRSSRAAFEAYRGAFLTQKDEPRAKLCCKAVCEAREDALDAMSAEALRLQGVVDALKGIEMAALTRDLFVICAAVLEEYERQKERTGALDFDDLIFKTLGLLKGRDDGVADHLWVHYKLDQGLDHILIDEAQDTNPEQWQIIDALCADFFEASEEADGRSIFTVGDDKQSIYSFQRASPEEFERMRGDMRAKIEGARKRWANVDLNISFRSVRSVLEVVDAVFADMGTQHSAFRRGQAGVVELWPLFSDDEAVGSRLWEPPIAIESTQSGAVKCAEHIAQQIKGWIEGGEVLESHGRAIEAGDIMVLVRTRSAFVHHLSRALKTLGVPVGGADRMVLNTQLVVQDVMAALRFALLPEDDLTLACLLKSPFIGMSEQALFDLAHDREGSLWARVRNAGASELVAYLRGLITSSHLSPYDFISKLLHAPCPADAVSGQRAVVRRLGVDAVDGLNELMNVALDYESKGAVDLQNFVYAQEAQMVQVKREQEEGGGCVRIMTVHGSKGLQAPIVIMPDTVSVAGNAPAQSDKRLLWPSQSGGELPLWAPRKTYEAGVYLQAKERVNERLDKEYRRLLYVAMTRAEDRLYVTGYHGAKEPAEHCWYNLVRAGFLRLGDDAVEVIEGEGADVLRYSNPQTHEPDRELKEGDLVRAASELPRWALEQAPEERVDVGVYRPSQIEDEEACSPLRGVDNYRFLRGNLTHKLLQILPEMEVEARSDAAVDYMERYGQELSAGQRASVVSEVLKILHDAKFAPLFGPGSQAEVPVSAYIEGRGMMSGQVDRLLVSEDSVYIIDFKTNRPPPREVKDIPEIYVRQMRAYGDALSKIYPGKCLYAALLWTDGPYLMEVELS